MHVLHLSGFVLINYYPIHNQEEDQRREQAPLLHSSLYDKRVCELAIVYGLACGIFIELLDGVDELWWHCIVMHQFPYDVSVHTVEGFLEVGKGHVEGGGGNAIRLTVQ